MTGISRKNLISSQHPWLYGIVLLVPLSVLIGHGLGGSWHWLTPLFVFGIVPVFDHLLGEDRRNPYPGKIVEPSGLTTWQLITWSIVPIQVLLVVWGGWVISHHHLNWSEAIGLTVSVGVSSGVLGINASHELQHRINHRWEIWFSRLILMSVGYMHWAIEHVAGHHRHVATPMDPATARYGESLYQFLPRTIVGGFASACRLEAKRLERQKKNVLSGHNRIVRYVAIELLFLALLVFLCGGRPCLTGFCKVRWPSSCSKSSITSNIMACVASAGATVLPLFAYNTPGIPVTG